MTLGSLLVLVLLLGSDAASPRNVSMRSLEQAVHAASRAHGIRLEILSDSVHPAKLRRAGNLTLHPGEPWRDMAAIERMFGVGIRALAGSSSVPGEIYVPLEIVPANERDILLWENGSVRLFAERAQGARDRPVWIRFHHLRGPRPVAVELRDGTPEWKTDGVVQPVLGPLTTVEELEQPLSTLSGCLRIYSATARSAIEMPARSGEVRTAGERGFRILDVESDAELETEDGVNESGLELGTGGTKNETPNVPKRRIEVTLGLSCAEPWLGLCELSEARLEDGRGTVVPQRRQWGTPGLVHLLFSAGGDFERPWTLRFSVPSRIECREFSLAPRRSAGKAAEPQRTGARQPRNPAKGKRAARTR